MNIITVQAGHEMFQKEFSGELSNFIYNGFAIVIMHGEDVIFGARVLWHGDVDGTEFGLVYYGGKLVEDNVWYTIKTPPEAVKAGRIEVYCSTDDKQYTENGYDIACIILRIMLYIMTASREKIVKKKSENSIAVGNKKRITDTGENKIYLLDDIVEYVAENKLYSPADSGRKIYCPCWSVRGHYRHYKSGKTIFIENYLKGKDREKAKPKDKEYFV